MKSVQIVNNLFYALVTKTLVIKTYHEVETYEALENFRNNFYACSMVSYCNYIKLN